MRTWTKLTPGAVVFLDRLHAVVFVNVPPVRVSKRNGDDLQLAEPATGLPDAHLADGGKKGGVGAESLVTLPTTGVPASTNPLGVAAVGFPIHEIGILVLVVAVLGPGGQLHAPLNALLDHLVAEVKAAEFGVDDDLDGLFFSPSQGLFDSVRVRPPLRVRIENLADFLFNRTDLRH